MAKIVNFMLDVFYHNKTINKGLRSIEKLCGRITGPGQGRVWTGRTAFQAGTPGCKALWC